MCVEKHRFSGLNTFNDPDDARLFSSILILNKITFDKHFKAKFRWRGKTSLFHYFFIHVIIFTNSLKSIVDDLSESI